MRKTPPKLALRKQTLRTLSKLSLARAVGGQGEDAPLFEGVTYENGCPAAMALKA